MVSSCVGYLNAFIEGLNDEDDDIFEEKYDVIQPLGIQIYKNIYSQYPPPKGGGFKEPLLTSLSKPPLGGELRWFGMYRHRGMFILVPRSAVSG